MKVLVIFLTLVVTTLNGHMYEQTHDIIKMLLDSSVYSPIIRPPANQSEAIKIQVHFDLVSILAVDDTNEFFSCNGFLTFNWVDERFKWNSTAYGDVKTIHPLPKQIWRPRMALLNTLTDRDIFGDDVSPVVVSSNGSTVYAPGSVFTTSCSLNLLKYPFDVQTCSIQMVSMGAVLKELVFEPGECALDNYNINGEWDLLQVNVTTDSTTTNAVTLSNFNINFQMRRRPTFYLFTIVLPFVLLSFLNLMVFNIPQESGEKIGYGITVLLALSVFFSIIGGMLPRSSHIVPYIIIYLFILYLISALAVIISIVIAYIYHLEERQEQNMKVLQLIKRIATKAPFRNRPNAVDTIHFPAKVEHDEQMEPVHEKALNSVKSRDEFTDTKQRHLKETPGDAQRSWECENSHLPKHFKALAASVDFASFFIFVFTWLGVTIWFFASVLT